jgi:hypothetical protein
MRAQLMHAVQTFGHMSTQATAARRAYRQTVRSTKSRFLAEHQQQAITNLYENPKSFWKVYNDRSPVVCGTVDQWTDFFQRLFQGNVAGEYVGGNLEQHCAAFHNLFPQPSDESRAAASMLNVPFSEVEIQVALGQLACHKASGVDGIPAEFLQQAYVEGQAGGSNRTREFVLSPVITKVFNAVLHDSYPQAWQTSALVPVPKPKGRPDVFDDHRGIAVSPVIAKLFAIIMMTRLNRWAETRGLRAKGQAGFRPGRGTGDQVFILRHMIDTARARKRPLFCAFIDFSKAYDRVDRGLLWKILEGCGLHGAMLHTVKAMYESVRMQVRAGAELGTPFNSGVGVKQGCPISPLLFGILIDRLEPYLEQRCPGSGTQLAGSIIRALLYADDVVLMNDSANGLRAMLSALEDFCKANSMFVNATKSQVVVFNRGHSAVPGGLQFPINGASLPVDTFYVYLGIKFQDGQQCKATLEGAVVKARRAMYALFGRCKKQGWCNANLMCHLFDSLVKPVLCYGCEVWGVDWVSTLCRTGKFGSGVAEESIHKPFLRQVLGVGTTTSAAIMYKEMNRQPMSMFWLRMAAKLWNRALARQADDLLRVCLLENVRLAHCNELRQSDRKKLWAFHFTTCMNELGIMWQNENGSPQPVDLSSICTRMEQKWHATDWDVVDNVHDEWSLDQQAVRAAPMSYSTGFSRFTYMNWFAAEEWVRNEHWSTHLHKREHINAVAQIRLGSHWLDIQQGRMARPRRPRNMRCCKHCAGIVEDEAHLLECPGYADLRQRFGIDTCINPSDRLMRDFMTPRSKDGWHKLAEFVSLCRSRRTDNIIWDSSVAPMIPPAS